MRLPRGIAWVTGASSGIGWSTCGVLAKRGWIVAASARNATKLKRLAATHPQIHAYPMDAADAVQRKQTYEAIRKDHGPVDALVNNAGYGIRGTIEDVNLDDLRTLYDVNVFAPISLAKYVLPDMRDRRQGRIIMVSSVVGRVSFPINGAYSSSKFALEALSDALRIEVKPWNIHVSLVEPGPIATNFGTNARDLSLNRLKNPASPYSKNYKQFLSTGYYKHRHFWGPSACAEAIRHAAESDKPKTRYPVHPLAEWVPRLAMVLPTRIMDHLLGKKFGFHEDAEWKS